MKIVLPTVMTLLLWTGTAVSGPPEPVAPPEAPEALEIAREALESLKVQTEIEKGILDTRLKGILEKLDEGLEISQLSIAGDSIVITFSNDSTVVITNFDKNRIRTPGRDIVRVGRSIEIEEDQIVFGDVVSVFGDITVRGTVEGGVMAFSGNIYVTSTGDVKGGAVALSGKIKVEPGGRIESVTWGGKYPVTGVDFIETRPYRIMGFVLFIVFVVWMILAATGASIFKKNVATVVESIRKNAALSFLKGYLVYILIFVAFIVLSITLIGLPLAFLGVPIIALGAMVLSFIAVSNIIGQKVLHTDELSFKAFLYGSGVLSVIPALFFLILTMSGSLVIMIFCWIFVFFFLSAVLPLGLGAVMTTRFGVRKPGDSVDKEKSGQAI